MSKTIVEHLFLSGIDEERQRQQEQRRTRKQRALDLAQQHGINLSRAYSVVDGELTLKEARKREEQARVQKEQKRARTRRALDLAHQHGINLSRAFSVLDGTLTLEEARKREQQARIQKERRDQEKARQLNEKYFAHLSRLENLEQARIQQERLNRESARKVKAQRLVIQKRLPLDIALQVVDSQLTLKDAEEKLIEHGAMLAAKGGINRGNFGNNSSGPWWAPRKKRRP